MRHVILSALLLTIVSSTTTSSASILRPAPISPLPRICLDSTATCPPSQIRVAF